jgi:hypothetical protein
VRGVGDPVIDEKLLSHDALETTALRKQGLEPAGQLAVPTSASRLSVSSKPIYMFFIQSV